MSSTRIPSSGSELVAVEYLRGAIGATRRNRCRASMVDDGFKMTRNDYVNSSDNFIIHK